MNRPQLHDDAILARWPGKCPYCSHPIERGDLIIKVAGAWLHEDCAAERECIARAVARELEDEEG